MDAGHSRVRRIRGPVGRAGRDACVKTEAEYEQAYARLTRAAYRHGSGLTTSAAHEALTETLAAIGVFTPTPNQGPATCTVLYLPTEPEELDAGTLGVWQQCADESGRDGDEHDSGIMNWSDHLPGAPPTGA
ncbi:hypothetical protein [Streptomyces sp. NPDC059819]|uniref:hypothetical protein n=1 Tax=Streptomyces sp. NPDC059819 TaxID=3346963 RepID=UPI003654F236